MLKLYDKKQELCFKATLSPLWKEQRRTMPVKSPIHDV